MPEVGTRTTFLKYSPTFKGENAEEVSELIRTVIGKFHNTISLDQLIKALDSCEHVYAFEFYLNGELLCDIEITW